MPNDLSCECGLQLDHGTSEKIGLGNIKKYIKLVED